MYQSLVSRLLLTYKVEKIYYTLNKNIIEERTNNFANDFLNELEKENIKINKKKKVKIKKKRKKKKETKN